MAPDTVEVVGSMGAISAPLTRLVPFTLMTARTLNNGDASRPRCSTDLGARFTARIDNGDHLATRIVPIESGLIRAIIGGSSPPVAYPAPLRSDGCSSTPLSTNIQPGTSLLP